MNLYIPSGAVQLSGNPIWIIVANAVIPAGATNYCIVLQVTSLNANLKGGPFLDAIPPDASGDAIFDISGYIDQPVEPTFQWPPTGIAGANAQALWYINIQCGFTYIDADGNRVTTIEGEDANMQVLKGGLSDLIIGEYNDLHTDFYGQWIQAGKFLTNQPNNQVVSPDQIVKLWFLYPGETTIPAKWHIHAELGNAESNWDAEGEVDLYGVSDSETPTGLAEFSFNPVFAGLTHALSYGYIKSFTFWITKNSDDSDISERRTFIVDNTYHDDLCYLLVANSVSGVDVIRLTGEIVRSIDTTGTDGVRPFGITATAKTRTILSTSRSGRRKWQINTGFKSIDEMKAMIDVYLSRNLWLAIDGKLIPVTLSNANQLIADSLNDLHSADLEILEAHNMKFV